MPKRQLTLPDYYVPGIRGLIALTGAQANELISALQAERPIYYQPRQLANHLASKTSIDLPVLVEIITALAGLYTGRQITGLSVSDFSEAAFEAAEGKGLKPPEPQSWASFKANLVELLKLEGAIAIASKAHSIVTEQDKIFLDTRILSDLRPVFKDDPEAPPSAVAIIHTLRIHYQQTGELKSFFVAMDDEDLKKLKDALDRAQKKSATLRSVAGSGNIPLIDIGGEPQT
jgi:hypothetical protein